MKTLLGALKDKGQFCCISELGVAAGEASSGSDSYGRV